MDFFEGTETSEMSALLDRLHSGQALLWTQRALPAARVVLDRVSKSHALGPADIESAAALLRRWGPALTRLFPELAASDGLIESALRELPDASPVTGVHIAGRTLIKGDHALPVAGSIKARGGIFEVLAHAEQLGANAGWMPQQLEERNQTHVLGLLDKPARTLFARHTIAVGSTGNLGLSIGIMAAALGFRAVVHMSHDAKAWKKTRLRQAGVEVIEHPGDYASAVAAGRAAAATDATIYFVDDENSRNLFLGYAVAASRLKAQLDAANVTVDAAHPLVVHLPCGVGGAPGGISFGLKHVFGDAVHCFFAEPCAAPAMLVRMTSTDGPRSVYDIGLNNRTEADGLAVAQASELVFELVGDLIAGVYTVPDDDLFRALAALHTLDGTRIEPSAAAAFCGLRLINDHLQEAHPAIEPSAFTHVFWTTGGRFVPAAEYERFLQRGMRRIAG